jgi:NTE family protein
LFAFNVNAPPLVPRLRPAAAAAPEPESPADDPTLRQRVAQMIDTLLPKRAPEPPQPGLVDLMSRSLDAMQAQMSRVQLALDPPDLLIRVPRDACMFHEFWRARELIEIGREAAEQALAEAGVGIAAR